MPKTTRREFLTNTALAAGALALGGRFSLAEPAVAFDPVKVKSGTDVVTLGKTGIKTSVLGMGTGTIGGREQRNMGQDSFVRLVREAFDRGIRYIDTADMYKIHPFIAAAIKELPKSQFFIQTKTQAKDAAKAKADVERFRRELGLETLDTVLIHAMTNNGWPSEMRPVIDVLLDAKAKGRIRAIGVSCHSLEALIDAADCPEMEVHLVRINPVGKLMDDKPERVAAQIARMRQKNRGVIGMKIYGEGDFKTREQRLDSLKYVLGLGALNAMAIGFSKIEHIDETLELIKQATA